MQQLFLDANTYLGFYYLTPREIDELAKLVDLLRYKKINLLLPGQVEDEVRRNREVRIEAALKPLADARLQAPLPALAERTSSGDALKKSLSETNKARQQLLTELLPQAESHQLPADRLVSGLMVLSQRIPDKAVFTSAAQRKALGNPPGRAKLSVTSSTGKRCSRPCLTASIYALSPPTGTSPALSTTLDCTNSCRRSGYA